MLQYPPTSPTPLPSSAIPKMDLMVAPQRRADLARPRHEARHLCIKLAFSINVVSVRNNSIPPFDAHQSRLAFSSASKSATLWKLCPNVSLSWLRCTALWQGRQMDAQAFSTSCGMPCGVWYAFWVRGDGRRSIHSPSSQSTHIPTTRSIITFVVNLLQKLAMCGARPEVVPGQGHLPTTELAPPTGRPPW